MHRKIFILELQDNLNKKKHFSFQLPDGDDCVNDGDHSKRYCLVNCYFRLNLYSVCYGC